MRGFGNYELVERIGIGAMSEVFLARRLTDGAEVALKRLFPLALGDADLLAAIREEAALVAKLDHPAIVRARASGMAEGAFFVEYDLVAGRDLADVLAQARATKARASLAVALSIALPILRGLVYVHSDRNGARKALVHRDVAPSNVLVGFDGQVKLTDFGIAHEAGRTSRRTQEGLVKGTARYMSPEQARGAELDAGSDLFSFGCVLAELLVGEPLRPTGVAASATLSEVAVGGLDFAALEANAPPKLRAIVFKLLAQSRGERYHRGDPCIEELEDFCRGAKVSVGSPVVAAFMASLFPRNEHGSTTIPETLPRTGGRGSAPSAGPSVIPQQSEESLTMADEKGGSDLDVFEGLAKKSSRSPVSAVPPPPGPPSKRATTLLGVSPPAKVDVPPPPSAPPASKAPPPPPGARVSAPPVPPPASMRSPSSTSTPIPAPPTSKAPPPPPLKSTSAPPPPAPAAAVPPPPAKGGTLMMDSKDLGAPAHEASKPPPPPTTLVAAVAPPPQPPASIGAALGIPSAPESAEGTDEATPAHGKKGSKKRGAKVDMDWEDDEESTHVFEQKQHALPKPTSPKKQDGARVDAKSAALMAGSGASARPISVLPPPPAVPAPLPAPLPIPAPTMPKMVPAADPVPSRAMEDRPTPLPARQQSSGSSGRIALILGALALVAVLGLGAYIIVGGSGPSTGSLRIEVKTKGGASIAKAEISVDGVKKCDATPCVATELKPGSKSITVVIAGSVNGTSATGIVDAGKENFVSVTVDDAVPSQPVATTPPTTQPSATPPAPKGTGIIVAGPANMKILVDGKEAGTTSSSPLTLGTLSVGKHEIKIDGGKDYEPVTKSVEVKQDTLVDLGEIKLKVLTGHLKIDLKTAGAKVVLKSKGKPDKPLGDDILKSDLAINIDTKQSWTIVATKAGFDDFTQDITFDDGAADKTLPIELNEKGKPPVVPNPTGTTTGTPPVMTSTKPENPPDAMGTIAIGSIPPANALVDGAPAGKTPTSKKVAPGSHTVVFVFPSGSRKSVSVTVKAGETKSASARDN